MPEERPGVARSTKRDGAWVLFTFQEGDGKMGKHSAQAHPVFLLPSFWLKVFICKDVTEFGPMDLLRKMDPRVVPCFLSKRKFIDLPDQASEESRDDDQNGLPAIYPRKSAEVLLPPPFSVERNIRPFSEEYEIVTPVIERP